MPKVETQTKKYKWVVEDIDKRTKSDLSAATPIPNLQNLHLDEDIISIQRSETGSEGVFFVTVSSGVFVIKPSRNIATEVFSNMLAMKLGIYCPKIRILHSDSFEGKKLLDKVIENDKTGLARHMLEQAEYILVKEFVLAKNLDKFKYEDMLDLFGTEVNLNSNCEKRLKELAIILALDILTNNSDRLPLIWDNSGNAGNLMMTSAGQFITIENSMTSFNPTSSKFDTYANRVKTLLQKLIISPNIERGEFTYIIQKFVEFADYSFGEAGIIFIQLGFCEFLRNIVDVDISEEISIWKSLLEKYSPQLVGLSGIDLGYVGEMWKLLQDFGKQLKAKI